MGVGRERHFSLRYQQAASHPQVNQKLCLNPQLVIRGFAKNLILACVATAAQVHHDRLPHPPHALDGRPGQRFDDLSLRRLEGLRLAAGPNA
jgi:hypothetical protein